MAKKHDEERDLKLLSKVAKISYHDKTISCPKNATIGIHMWGRIDFLTHYCGWHLIWNNSVIVSNEDFNKPTRTDRKDKKEHKLTDKTKRNARKNK